MENPLSEYFLAAGAKRLSNVEVAPDASNQHEFNGIGEFKRIFGTAKRRFAARFIYVSDEQEEPASQNGTATWYDSREKHPTRSEFRLYYSSNDAIARTAAGDLVVIALIDQENIAVIFAQQNSTAEKQLLWLFGMFDAGFKFDIHDYSKEKQALGFAGKYIITSLGFEITESAPDYLEDMLAKFGTTYPSTLEFSAYARNTIKDVSPREEPDATLITWLEREELLFKTLEKVIIKEKLENGFGDDGADVDEFIRFSLSVQNRRKARAGHSFENHLSVLFSANEVHFSHGAVTERNNKPDFIFPGITEYHNKDFNVGLLTMLGVKTTAKDRWRQVLAEAGRITSKHLITLEPSISRNQTDDMEANNLQLVIPAPLMNTYSEDQQRRIIDISQFVRIVLNKQRKGATTLF